MLKITDLRATIDDIEILKGVNLQINHGETHAIMGPNGSGKSTLAKIIAGHPGYTVTYGSILFEDNDLLKVPSEERARSGIFMSFQHPIEIPGVRLDHFMRASYNELRKVQGGEELDVLKFDRLLKERVTSVDIDPVLTKRSVNEGFSGGERKRSEILQMSILEPRFSILDEIDSGLDVDALRHVAEGVNQLKGPDRSTLIVTHYQRILDYVIPDVVHVMFDGQIILTGDKELAKEVEANGYDWATNRVTPAKST